MRASSVSGEKTSGRNQFLFGQTHSKGVNLGGTKKWDNGPTNTIRTGIANVTILISLRRIDLQGVSLRLIVAKLDTIQ